MRWARLRRAKHVIVLLLALATTYFVFSDNLPPRTPRKIARLLSGLDVPRGTQIVLFEDEWIAFNGDGSSLVVLQPSASDMVRLMSEASARNYRSFSTREGFPDEVARNLPPDASGMHLSEGDMTNGHVVALDRVSGRLVAYVFIS